MKEFFSPEALEKVKKKSIYTFTCQGPEKGDEENLICKTCVEWRVQYGAEQNQRRIL